MEHPITRFWKDPVKVYAIVVGTPMIIANWIGWPIHSPLFYAAMVGLIVLCVLRIRGKL